MNVHRKVLGDCPSGTALPVQAPSPVPGLGPDGRVSTIAVDPRDRILAAELDAIRKGGMAKRAAWALLGLCNEAERLGLNVTYWRDLAADIEGRAG